MTRDPYTIDPEAPLGTAIDVMRIKEIRHLPVADESGKLVGILTERDLLKALLREYPETRVVPESFLW